MPWTARSIPIAVSLPDVERFAKLAIYHKGAEKVRVEVERAYVKFLPPHDDMLDRFHQDSKNLKEDEQPKGESKQLPVFAKKKEAKIKIKSNEKPK